MLTRTCVYICLRALLNTLAPRLAFPTEHLLPPLAVLLGNAPYPTCGLTQSGSQRDSSRHLFSSPGSAGRRQNGYPSTILLLICLLDSISDPNGVFAEAESQGSTFKGDPALPGCYSAPPLQRPESLYFLFGNRDPPSLCLHQGTQEFPSPTTSPELVHVRFDKSLSFF